MLALVWQYSVVHSGAMNLINTLFWKLILPKYTHTYVSNKFEKPFLEHDLLKSV